MRGDAEARAGGPFGKVRCDVDVPGITMAGKRYRRREKKTIGRYTTMAGLIGVERTSCWARGQHGSETIAALNLRLGHWAPVAAEVGSTFMAAVPPAEAAAAREPIGSGVQKVACKAVVGEKMKRSGMTWRTLGGRAIHSPRGLASQAVSVTRGMHSAQRSRPTSMPPPIWAASRRSGLRRERLKKLDLLWRMGTLTFT